MAMAPINRAQLALVVLAGATTSGPMPEFETSGQPGLGKASRVSFRSKVRTGPKVGRNEPCPCGSGQKFKRCCINK